MLLGSLTLALSRFQIFLSASVEERVQRRLRELEAKGQVPDKASLDAEIRERDERDRATQEKLNGAWPNPAAILMDSTGLSVEAQVDKIIQLVTSAAAESS